MKVLRAQSALAFGGLLSVFSSVRAADECVPWTWTWNLRRAAAATPTVAELGATPMPEPTVVPYARKDAEPQPGEVNCRNWGQTYDNVGYWSCSQLATEFGITIEKFWELNPELAPDCEGVQPNTEYCVAGFIEPVRAVDGRCGPDYKNATCIGTEFGQCCNSETWKCGDTEHDCSLGVCYEGQCPGHKIYTTDGNCGYKFNFSQCAGKWGPCCNLEGRCGTGLDFCGEGKCQSGNCTEWNTPA
ncbi:hypothetical protein QBC40DRAFT_262788 [Triangularia verruculosa]|uniref:Uncharacterized protein n=1 Tax=Triangularia verruculosa TaxID=2587418 RepID=A0AAN7AXX3_9PEZI|nr:hypothetical protein QBC40DRAFT_262788 [Triangularia verruculosa]